MGKGATEAQLVASPTTQPSRAKMGGTTQGGRKNKATGEPRRTITQTQKHNERTAQRIPQLIVINLILITIIIPFLTQNFRILREISTQFF